ncbi:MAG: zinc metallopeptidase, partial [Fervidobacterium sp.]
MYYDPTFILLLPALLLAIWAQVMVQSNFSKYSQVKSRLGMSGAEMARFILDASGLYDVRIEMIPGSLTDHYDPRAKVVRLSQAT